MLNINENLLDQLDESQYFLICKLMKYGKRSCPKNDVLSNATGWGINKVQKVKKQLVSLGFLTVKPRYKMKGNKRVKDSNEYRITTNLISKFRGEEIEKKPIEKVVFHVNDFHVDEFEVDDFHVDEFEVDENGVVIKVLRILSIENKEVLRYLKEKKSIKKEIPEQSNSLKSKPHSSEEKEKSSAKKEKRTFPDNTPAKSYDPRDKRTDKNIPFDLVSSTKTLEAVYPEIKTLCSEIKQYYGFSISEGEAKERVSGFCSVAITNYSKYRQIRTVDALKDKLLNWMSNGIRNGYDTGIYKQPTKDGLPELKLIRKAKRQ